MRIAVPGTDMEGRAIAADPGRDETCFKFMLDYLEQRNVCYRKTTKPL